MKSKDGKNEIISVEEEKWRKYKKQFEDQIESYKTQIELDGVMVEYCEKKVKSFRNP